MAITVVGTTAAAYDNTGGGTVTLTFTGITNGLKAGDLVYFMSAGVSGGVLQGADNKEAFSSVDDDFFSYNFNPSASPLVRLDIWACAILTGDSRIGNNNVTFTLDGGSSGASYKLTAGLISQGIIIRGSAGYDSGHVGLTGGGNPNDRLVTALLPTGLSAGLSAHTGETGASGHQVISWYAGGSDKTTTTMTAPTWSSGTSGWTDLTGGGVISADADHVFVAAYYISAVADNTEPATTLTINWTGGGNTRGEQFRAVERHLINNDPVAAFTATVVDTQTVTVDMSASSDPDTVIPATWDVVWGDGNSDLGLNRAGGTTTKSHIYAAAGYYTITVTVYDNIGASNSTTHSVYVEGPPVQGPGFKIPKRNVKIHALPYDLRTFRLRGEL